MLFAFSVCYFVVVIIIAHLFVPPAYSWRLNTISDLAAQGLPNQWIMQLGFIGFGVLLTAAFVGKFAAARKVFSPDLFVVLYGLAVLMSGFFSARPFLADMPYSVQEDTLHSLFAQAAGILFTLGILFHLIVAASPQEKQFHTVFLFLVVGASILFKLDETAVLHLGQGLVQRVLYLVSFMWLLVSQIVWN
ncbi:MAG: DUF998 domain-containing protein [Ardenticatenaceae bacterium]|nr:DUF998 domain-containing protein [Anaerolineales bacterium]MCB8923783.1 DUF998 domain-containing protein [Ardenticatenaceae bacterium]MCB8990118.1 DUF998 domain-containing protein [Ardenticatenaceae bacterium]